MRQDKPKRQRKNALAGLLSSLHLTDRRVMIGIGVVIVLLAVSIIVGSKFNTGSENLAKPDDKDKYVREEVVEVAVNEPDYYPETSKTETATAPEASETQAEETKEAPKPTEDMPQAPATPEAPKIKTDEEIRKEVDRATDVSDNENMVFSVASIEQKPQFPGGEDAMYRWLGNNLVYPSDAMENGIQGRVIVQFIVSSTGEIQNVEVIRGKYPSLDREAARVVKSMPRWSPGRQNGRPVNVSYTIPITFRLQ